MIESFIALFALSLMEIVLLVARVFTGNPISKGCIYFAMAFSLLVESFHLRIRSRSQPKESAASPSAWPLAGDGLR